MQYSDDFCLFGGLFAVVFCVPSKDVESYRRQLLLSDDGKSGRNERL